MRKKKTWILLADGGRARIIERISPLGKLKELHSLSHTHQLSHVHGNDRPGRTFESAAPIRHAYDPSPDWHELQKESFAKELTTFLKHASHNQLFEELHIISSPQMLGYLRTHLDKNGLASKITKEDHKDLLGIPLNELPDYLDNLPPKKRANR
ncbi:MAG: host attachment protein [Alphaproteobacteria bacterium]|nr:host attachment protein [Alphaproteobacteria bacterium]